jgi:hypothetical protein
VSAELLCGAEPAQPYGGPSYALQGNTDANTTKNIVLAGIFWDRKQNCASFGCLQSFCVVLNQHSPMADQAAHFLVTLKRPEQRQLDQQRKVCHMLLCV